MSAKLRFPLEFRALLPLLRIVEKGIVNTAPFQDYRPSAVMKKKRRTKQYAAHHAED